MEISVRENRLAETFVELADTLADGFDVADFAGRLAARCVELLDISAAGLMLADPAGRLCTTATSVESGPLRELFDLQYDEGPCLDCYRTASTVQPVALSSATAGPGRWPRFAPRAAACGFHTTYAVPMRLRDTVIGALNLLVTGERPPAAGGELGLAQSLADAATIGILQQRTVHQGEVLTTQLQTALTSRVLVEQAKGVLAERWGTSVDTAFAVLRRYARARRIRLNDVAGRIVDGTLDSDELR